MHKQRSNQDKPLNPFYSFSQHQGRGCFVFENGDVWQGEFSEDRPVIPEGGQPFAPHGAHLALSIEDLVEEEESPSAALKGINNVLMTYNSDLRSLYDKYW